MKPIKDIRLSPGIKVSELIEQFREAGGFSAKYLGIAASILKEMIGDKRCVKFISFVGAPVATGIRGVIAEEIKRGMFDVIITTCGAIDHDIARSLGQYYDGDFWMDDEELRGGGYIGLEAS